MNRSERAVLPAPDSLRAEDGTIRYGIYNEPLKAVDFSGASYKALGLTVPSPLRKLGLKEWQHFALTLPDRLITFAIVDVKYLHLAWCQVVDLTSGERFEHRVQGIRAIRSLSSALWDEWTRAHIRGFHIDIHNNLSSNRHEVNLLIEESGQGPRLELSLTCLHDLSRIEPLVVVLPLGNGRTMYSHKVPLPAQGRLIIDGVSSDVDPDDCFVTLDIHKATYPHHTWWKWATLAGMDSSGRRIGINVTKNIVEDDDTWNENALWIDGRLARLSAAVFERRGRTEHDPWNVATRDGEIDLVFTPLGNRKENLNVGIIRSKFDQFYGRFHGTVRSGEEAVEIDGFLGLCEDHDSLW